MVDNFHNTLQNEKVYNKHFDCLENVSFIRDGLFFPFFSLLVWKINIGVKSQFQQAMCFLHTGDGLKILFECVFSINILDIFVF